MNPDDAGRSDCTATGALTRGGGARATRVVLVADGDADVTDRVAGLLRDAYTVRTAYESDAVLASLDEDVSVVLLDPALPGLSLAEVRERLADEAVDFRVAALTEDRATDHRFDDQVRKPVSPEPLRSTVDRLCRCVEYRAKLERFYDLACTRASLPPGSLRRERLAERLAELDAELDAVANSLDSVDAYEAALRDPGTER